MIDITKLSEMGWEMVLIYAPRVLLALLTLVIGLWIINKFMALFGRSMEKKHIDDSLKKYSLNLSSVVLKVLLFISVASMVGIKTTSFVAVLGAAGLAVGLALQGSLSNFAGGALILLFRPFKVGDFIEAQGLIGTVQEIQLFTTVLISPDNKRLILPNGPVAGGTIVNFNVEPNRRIDWTFGISYSDDIAKAKKVFQDVIQSDPRVLKDPAAMVVVSGLGDSSVNFIVRAWVKPQDYWDLNFAIIERVKLELDRNKISIPFPQRDVHLYQSMNGSLSKTGAPTISQ